MKASGQLHAPGRFTPGTPWIESSVGSSVGLDAAESPCRESNLGRHTDWSIPVPWSMDVV
jgi:hypothetical protein